MVKHAIFLYGAASSGKTTLANWISKEFGYHKINEVVRNIEGFDIKRMYEDEDYAKNMQEKAILDYFNILSEEIKKHDKIVVDRYFYDFFVYGLLYSGDLEWIKGYAKTIELYRDIIERDLNVDIFELAPVGFDNDGFRYSQDYRRECKIFRETDFDRTYISTTDFEERKKLITDFINN